jgi:hypothetical protein
MTPRSSAWFISYDLRPGKQIERRIVLDSLQSANAVGFGIADLPLIGMGGVRFIDFLLANRMLGMRKFISLEHDAKLVPRCEFNKPFHDFEIFRGSSDEYVETIGFKKQCVIWLDHERGISKDLRDDMVSLAGSVVSGSFVFITATAELPSRIRKINRPETRLAQIRADLDPFGSDLTLEDVKDEKFHAPAARILRRALSFGFAGRGDGTFFPYVRLNYKDTTWMMTVGGYFGPPEEATRLERELSRRCPFLKPRSEEFVYVVEQFNITDAERRLFDRASLAGKSRRSERMALKKLGFRTSIVDQYSELMRFIPRYFESVL